MEFCNREPLACLTLQTKCWSSGHHLSVYICMPSATQECSLLIYTYIFVCDILLSASIWQFNCALPKSCSSALLVACQTCHAGKSFQQLRSALELLPSLHQATQLAEHCVHSSAKTVISFQDLLSHCEEKQPVEENKHNFYSIIYVRWYCAVGTVCTKLYKHTVRPFSPTLPVCFTIMVREPCQLCCLPCGITVFVSFRAVAFITSHQGPRPSKQTIGNPLPGNMRISSGLLISSQSVWSSSTTLTCAGATCAAGINAL